MEIWAARGMDTEETYALRTLVPENLTYAVEKALETASRRARKSAGNRRKLEGETRNLVDLAARLGELAADALAERMAERDAIRRKLQALPDAVDPAALRDAVVAQPADLQRLFDGHPAECRQALMSILDGERIAIDRASA